MASIPQLLVPLMRSEGIRKMSKFACTLCSAAWLRLKVRYG